MLSIVAIFLAAAVVAVTLFRRIELGSVLGYLFAGALIGPSCLGLARELEGTMHFAELGVVMLLFLIGLELQPSRLWSMRRSVFGLGAVQVVLTAAVFALAARVAGDASRVDLLRAARADHARVFVLAIDDFESSMRALRVVQEHFPHLRIVARARNRQHAYALLGAGVDQVIRETFAGSVEAARITLEELGIAHSEARRAVDRFASYDEAMIRKTYGMRDDEKALIESARKYATELEQIFKDDERSREEL